MLWQHNAAEPVGAWPEFQEDERGLKLSGSLVLGVRRADEAH